MMNNNKILTVSYGTFSCTLEGFEDSFGTMKAIAEYFRDLAADDRYFGAEPPQPDAEMLARIAQKEVSRRVEAREQDGKIVLSALADHRDSDAIKEMPAADVAETAAEAAPVAAPVTEKEAVSIRTAPIDIDALSDAEDTPEVVIEDVAEAAPETDIAETEAATQDASETAEVPAPEETEAEGAMEEAEAVTMQADEDSSVDEDENDIVPGQPDADIEAFFADSPKVAEPDEENMGQDAPVAPAAPAVDSIAAKLQRIRAVVAQQEAADEDDDYLEDEHAAPAAAAKPAENTSDVIAAARADIEEALNADDATDTAAQNAAQAGEMADKAAAPTADEQDDDINGILSRLESQPEKAADLEKVARHDPAETLAGADADDLIEDTDTSIEDTVGNLFNEQEETLEEPAEATTEKRMPLRKSPRVEASPELSVENAPEKPAAPRIARVIKVKRADLEAAIEKGDLEEYDDDEDLEDVAAAKPAAPIATKRENPGLRDLDDLAPARSRTKTTLSPEDEAELTRELAALEDDISAKGNTEAKAGRAEAFDDDLDDGDDYEEDDIPQAAAVTPRRPGSTSARRALPAIDEGGEADVNRLLAETDHQMDEPESATRRDAFAHLRAAVAAKKADVAAGGDDTTEDSGDDYRNDLAEVVRPRRPVSTSARTERPAEARPAPLKLVAEQRIDVEKPRAQGPVRPRRVAAATEVESDLPDGESFSDFAADMGATTLPQLLEAAAAYMSFVEGREQFSRPQLMSKVRQAGGEADFSREDGLRSFGQLLRTGKIEKIKAGRFTVSDEIGYRPDQRAAG